MAAQAYLTKTEFLAQTIPSEVFTGLTDDQINAAILWASGHAASYLRKRHTLPLITWGEELKRAVGRLAAFDLLARRGVRVASGNNEIVEDLANKAEDWLGQVASGDVEIDCVDSTPDEDEGGAEIESVQQRSNWSITTGRR